MGLRYVARLGLHVSPVIDRKYFRHNLKAAQGELGLTLPLLSVTLEKRV